MCSRWGARAAAGIAGAGWIFAGWIFAGRGDGGDGRAGGIDSGACGVRGGHRLLGGPGIAAPVWRFGEFDAAGVECNDMLKRVREHVGRLGADGRV